MQLQPLELPFQMRKGGGGARIWLCAPLFVPPLHAESQKSCLLDGRLCIHIFQRNSVHFGFEQ